MRRTTKGRAWRTISEVAGYYLLEGRANLLRLSSMTFKSALQLYEKQPLTWQGFLTFEEKKVSLQADELADSKLVLTVGDIISCVQSCKHG